MKRTINTLFVLLLMATAISGCGLMKRQPTQNEPTLKSENPEQIARNGGIAANFHHLTFSATFTLTSKGTETSLDGEVRMVHDSLIWISMRKFGLEVARMMLSKDSVWMLDRINSRYFAGDYRFFLSQYRQEADFNMVEALLLANPFENWSDNLVFEGCSDNRCRIVYNGRYRINQGVQGRSLPEGSGVMDQVVVLSETTGRILENSLAVPDQNRRLSVVYTGWKKLEGQLFPENSTLTVEDQANTTILKIGSSGFSSGTILTFPFKIPPAYKPMM